MLAAFFLASCSSDRLDGDWDPMKWSKTDYKIINEDGTKYYYVPQKGRTFSFTCKNYRPWISGMSITTDGSIQHLYPSDDDWHMLEYDQIHVEVENNIVTIGFSPNSDNHLHRYELTLTAGDVFHTFRFIQ